MTYSKYEKYNLNFKEDQFLIYINEYNQEYKLSDFIDINEEEDEI